MVAVLLQAAGVMVVVTVNDVPYGGLPVVGFVSVLTDAVRVRFAPVPLSASVSVGAAMEGTAVSVAVWVTVVVAGPRALGLNCRER